MSEALEKAARAICEDAWGPGQWVERAESTQQEFRGYARAAITAFLSEGHYELDRRSLTFSCAACLAKIRSAWRKPAAWCWRR